MYFVYLNPYITFHLLALTVFVFFYLNTDQTRSSFRVFYLDVTTYIHCTYTNRKSLLIPSPYRLPSLRSGAEAIASRPAPLRLIMFTLPAVTHFLSASKAHSLLQALAWLLLSLTTGSSKQTLFTHDTSLPCQGWLIKMTDCTILDVKQVA